MPKVTLTYADEAAIPADLKAFKTADNKVEVWVGDKVAEETNVTLAANRDTILSEKTVIEDKYKALVSTSGKDAVAIAEKIAELTIKAEKGATISPEDQKILDTVKSVKEVTVTPEYLAEAVKNYKSVSEKLANTEKLTQDAEFFKATGFKSEKAFQKAIADKEANPKLVKYYTETTKDAAGKEVVSAYAEYKKDDGTNDKVAFHDYVEKQADWGVYKPALLGSETQNWIPATQNSNPTQPFQPTPNNGTGTNPFLDAAMKGQAKINEPAAKAAVEQTQK